MSGKRGPKVTYYPEDEAKFPRVASAVPSNIAPMVDETDVPRGWDKIEPHPAQRTRLPHNVPVPEYGWEADVINVLGDVATALGVIVDRLDALNTSIRDLDK